MFTVDDFLTISGLFLGIKKLILGSSFSTIFFGIISISFITPSTTLLLSSSIFLIGLDLGLIEFCVNFWSSSFLIGLDFGLIIPCVIFCCSVILSKTGFFKGIIVNYSPYDLVIISEINIINFTNRDIFFDINLTK